MIPTVPLSAALPLFLGAMAIALVALTDTISTASSFAERRGEDVDGNKEMIGIGAANASAGLVGALMIALMLVAFPSLFADLPQPTLAAVVITAAFSLADIPATRRLWHQRRTDFAIASVAFLGVVLLGVLPGIVIAVVMSVANVFRRPGGPTTRSWVGFPGSQGCTTRPFPRRPSACPAA